MQKFMLLPGSKSVPLLQTICSFSDLKVLVPAGRFDVQVLLLQHGNKRVFASSECQLYPL